MTPLGESKSSEPLYGGNASHSHEERQVHATPGVDLAQNPPQATTLESSHNVHTSKRASIRFASSQDDSEGTEGRPKWTDSVKRALLVAAFFLTRTKTLCHFIVVFGISILIWLSEFFPKPQSPQPSLHYAAQRNYFSKAAVASEHPKCSELGVHIMKRGGSAVDAAITILLCIGVINNFSSGIGGGGFMLVRQAAAGSDGTSGRVELIDYRETAPRGAHRDMFKENPERARTGMQVAAILRRPCSSYSRRDRRHAPSTPTVR